MGRLIEPLKSKEPKFPVGTLVRHKCSFYGTMVVASYIPSKDAPEYFCTWMHITDGPNGLMNQERVSDDFYESELEAKP